MKRLLASIATLVLAAPASAGLVYEMKYSEPGSSESHTQLVKVGEQAIRMGGGPSTAEVIYRSDRRELITLNNEKKSYAVMNEAEARRAASKIRRATADAQAAMASLTPEQRKLMEEIAGGTMAALSAPTPIPEVRATDREDEVAGIECRYVEIWLGEKRERELCVAPWVSVKGGDQVSALFTSLAELTQIITGELANSAGALGNAVSAAGSQVYDRMTELKGLPVLSREFDDKGKVVAEQRLVEIREEDIPADQFEPTAGYTRENPLPLE